MGNLTFLFTDIEGSTRLWEEDAEAMRQALARHDSLLREVIESSGGRVFKTTGDGFCAVFPAATLAARAAVTAQLAITGYRMKPSLDIDECRSERIRNMDKEIAGAYDLKNVESSAHRRSSAFIGSSNPERSEGTVIRIPELKVRMAIHTGQAERRDGDYFGATLSRVARLLDACHGGQILLSGATQDAVGDMLPARVGLKALGVHRLRDLQDPERIFQILHPELPEDFAPLRTVNAPWIAHHGQASTTMAPPWFSFTALRIATPQQSHRDAASL